MTTSLTRRDRQKIARRAAILQAARAVFLSGNPYRATIEMVAREANVSKGTVYLYFESKEALLAELLREGLELLEAQLMAAYAVDEDLKPDVRIARVAGAFLEFAQAQPDYIRLQTAFETGQLEASIPTDVSHDIQRLSMRGIELIAQALQGGVRLKTFRHIDGQRVATALWASLKGALLLAGDADRPQKTGVQAETLFQVTLEIFLRALKPSRKRRVS